MPFSEPPFEQSKQPGRFVRIVRFFLYAMFGCTIFGGLAGVVAVFATSAVNPNAIHRDPATWEFLYFVTGIAAGAVAGCFVGTIGALVIALRR